MTILPIIPDAKRGCLAAFVAFALALQQDAFALPVRESADFNLKVEMDELPTPLTGSNTGKWAATNGIFRIDNAIQGDLYFGWNPANLSQETGWTLEVRLRIIQPPTADPDATSTVGAFLMSIQAVELNSGAENLNIVQVHPTGLRGQFNNRPASPHAQFTEGWNIVRLLEEPSSNKLRVWLNDIEIQDANWSSGTSSTLNRVLIGDLGGTVVDGIVEIDYVRLDTTGAFISASSPPEWGTIEARHDRDGLHLRFLTETAIKYFVEYKADLWEPQWSLLKTVDGLGSFVEVLDPAQALSRRFYRLREDRSVEGLPEIGVTNNYGIAVLDRELRYISPEANNWRPPRSAPLPDSAREAGLLPPLPAQIQVPFAWGVENLYVSASRALTSNIYQEPAKPWILHMGISTPGIGDTSSGSPQYKIWYRVSNDNGSSFSPLRQVILDEAGSDMFRPIPGVTVGSNGFNVDFTRPIVRSSSGEIMVPVGLHPLGENGKLYNPVGTSTFQDAGVLIGRWTEDGSDVKWNFGGWLRIDFNKSTRGLSEPAIAELEEGVFMMVSRGSNERRLTLPCYKWVSYSSDYCRTWSEPEPFTYSNGTNFFSPTACSTLVRSRVNNRIYWIGNISPTNPSASYPRFPLVIGEIDKQTRRLFRESVAVLDTRNPKWETAAVQLSNFHVFEDRATGNLIITVTRLDDVGSIRLTADAASWYVVGLPGAAE